jgi:hypothetical protein
LELAISGPASLLKLQLCTGEINGFLPPNVALFHGFRAAGALQAHTRRGGAFAAGETHFANAEMM